MQGLDVGVVGVDYRVLGAASEEKARVPDQVLIERLVLRDENRKGLIGPPSSSARLLPEARDGSRVPHDEASLHAADVDPQLQGVRRGDPQQLAREELSLDLPPVLGDVPAPVRPYSIREPRALTA